MINFFDTSFYDKESINYSNKRYNILPTTFFHFLFQRRLKHVLNIVKKYFIDKKEQILIEDGCADGIVVQTISKSYPDIFSNIIGTDISSIMIEQAKNINNNKKISFHLKNNVSNIKADCILAIGFVSPGIFEDEFEFIINHIKENGIAVVSLASGNSLYAKLKLRDKEITRDYWSFKRYTNFLNKYFEILDHIPYGIFIPKLWMFPNIARISQSFFENIFKYFPILFHERLYILKKRR